MTIHKHKQSAGILLYRKNAELEVFLVHPGGPFWQSREEGAWTIPKGEFTDEDPLIAAIREFKEETGKELSGPFIPLTPVRQKAGKLVYGWAMEGDIDPAGIQSNTYKMQWPPKSGKWQTFPEVDKGGWFTEMEAHMKINQAQVAFINELKELISEKR